MNGAPARYEEARQRAARERHFVRRWGGCVLQRLRACNVSSQQMRERLQPFRGKCHSVKLNLQYSVLIREASDTFWDIRIIALVSYYIGTSRPQPGNTTLTQPAVICRPPRKLQQEEAFCGQMFQPLLGVGAIGS